MKVIRPIQIITIATLFLTVQISAKSFLMGFVVPWQPLPSEEQVAQCDIVSLGFYAPIAKEGQLGECKRLYSSRSADSLVAMAHRNGVKATLSFGGGDTPIDMRVMGNDSVRALLISSIVSEVGRFNFDGVGNDWEPVWISDLERMWEINEVIHTHYRLFNKELRDSLDSRFGEGTKELNAAVIYKNRVKYGDSTSSDFKIGTHFPEGFHEEFKWIYIMGYDNAVGAEHGSFDAMLGPDGCVQHWIDEGVPKEKLVLGLPAYGRNSFIGAHPHVLYVEVIERFPDIDSTTDAVTIDFGDGDAVYGFNGQATMAAKVAECERLGLGGTFFYALNYDVPLDHPRSLLAVITSQGESIIQNHQSLIDHKILLTTEGNRLTCTLPQSPGSSIFQLYDLKGREMYKASITAGVKQFRVDLPVSRGSYIVQISGATFNKSMKVTVR